MKLFHNKKSNAIITVITAIMILLGTTTVIVYASDNTTVNIDPSSQIVSPGETFTVNVSCVPEESIKSFEFKLAFNASLLQANSVTEGNIFNGYNTFFNAGTINNSTGTIIDIYGLILGEGSVSDSGTFVSISFTAKDITGTSNLELYDVGVTNSTAYISIDVNNGSVSIEEYTLSITADGSGSVTKDPDQATYVYGDVVELTAVPDAGWSFSHWSGDLSGSDNPDSITITGDMSVTTHFTQNSYTLSISVSGSGSVTKDPDQATYVYGDVVELTAVPDAGWSFSHWSGDLSGSDNPDSITITGDMSVTAHFTQNSYTLSISVSGSGSVTKDPDQATYVYGDVVELTVVPDAGWSFSHWSGDLDGSVNPDSVTITGDMSVTAHFMDSDFPEISNVAITTSNPLDTDSSFGWINITCSVTDNVAVSDVSLNITNPDGSWNNVSMNSIGVNSYYYNSSTALSQYGNYSYFLWASDTSNNYVTSSGYDFSMPPNWDVNNDGYYNVYDLVLVSNHYNETSTAGWIREDVDNNGQIQVLDLVLISGHYDESWWV